MIHLREYATTAAFNADQTREYPTVSYVPGDAVYYEEAPQPTNPSNLDDDPEEEPNSDAK